MSTTYSLTLTEALALECRLITLNNYHADVRIGAYESERHAPQPMTFTLEVWIPLAASTAETLDGVYDYTTLAHAVDRAVASGHTDLQETFADRILDDIFSDTRVRAARITTRKPCAYEGADSVDVQTFRIAKN